MKSAFSLLELIFAIVILGIVASFAIPRFVDTKDSALVSTIRRDINTTINSVQSHYLLNGGIEKISDAVTVNLSNWNLENEDTKLTDKNGCLSLELTTSSSGSKVIDLKNTTKNSSICLKIRSSGIVDKIYELF